jgi:thiol-disulfide isomerase/thioredoxin
MRKIAFLFLIGINSFAQLPQFLEPDSSDCFLKSDFGQKATNTLKKYFENDSSKSFINGFSEKFNKDFNFGNNYKNILSKNIDDWEMELFDKKSQQLNFLKSKSNSIPSQTINFIKNEIEFNYWHLIFAYPIVRGNADQNLRRVISLPEIMISDFPNKSLSDLQLLNNKSFRMLLYYYISYHNSAQRKFVKYSDQLQGANDKAEFAINILRDQVLDYTLADILNKHKALISGGLARNLISQIEEPALQNYFKNDILPDILNKEIARINETEKKAEENLIKDYVELFDLNAKKFDFRKYKGKVIYVDFWASWCGPCRREIPFSKSMHETLSDKEKKDIVFLYISIDDAEETWKGAVKQLGLEGFENAYSPGGWASPVVQKYKIKGIPRYMIIDKSGNIIHLDATRPSDPNTIETLKKLVN